MTTLFIRSGLEAYRESWFHWLLLSTGLVVAGLVLEAFELVPEIFFSVRRKRRERSWGIALLKTDIPEWLKTVAFVGWFLVVLGVAGEFEADSFVSKADGFVQKFDEILLTDAQYQTELAKGRAGGAYERAATAEKEAAQLRREAEAEHLARVKIEAAVAWRQLSDKDKRDIGAAVAEFQSLAAASVWFNASSTEAEIFADDIAEALRNGKIIVQPPGGIMEMRESGKFGAPIKRPLTGVIVQSTKDNTASKFAASVIAELTRRGFDAAKQTDPPFGEGKFPQIWVNVEPRPKGPQGEYKLQAEGEAKAKNRSK